MTFRKPSLTPKSYFRDWMDRSTYLRRYSAKWHQSYRGQKIDWPMPKAYGSSRIDFKSQLTFKYPEVGLLEIPNGKVIGKNAWIVGENDTLLPEFSIFGTDVESLNRNILLPPAEPPIKKITGRCLSLVSTWPGNYYHFLLDSLPRHHLFEKAGFELADIDWVYCPPTKYQNTQNLLEKVGFKSSQLITAADDFGIQADSLFAPSFPGRRGNHPKWVTQFLKELANLPNEAPTRRLYISRKNWKRRLLNEEDVFSQLKRYGFEFYDPDQEENQPLDFNQADIIIAPHGAALANLVFCQPGTKVLELIPTDHPFGYFYTLSQTNNLNYAYLMGQSEHVRKKITSSPSKYDFTVDLSEFEATISEFLAI